MKNKKRRKKVVYVEDDGRTIFSMSCLDGLTPEQQEERNERRKNSTPITKKERKAMIAAAFQVYVPMFLTIVCGFGLVACLIYLFLK